MPATPAPVVNHSAAWVAQTWISFVVSAMATAAGIYFLPADLWMKGFLSMGLLFTIGSTLGLAKTVRDQHEATQFTKRVDEARVSKFIAEHDPMKPAL